MMMVESGRSRYALSDVRALSVSRILTSSYTLSVILRPVLVVVSGAIMRKSYPGSEFRLQHVTFVEEEDYFDVGKQSIRTDGTP
jgi:hypothetical protein